MSRIHLCKCYPLTILIFERKISATPDQENNVVLRYRFKHAMDDVTLSDEKYNNMLMHEAYAKVCRSIEGHKRAVESVLLHVA